MVCALPVVVSQPVAASSPVAPAAALYGRSELILLVIAIRSDMLPQSLNGGANTMPQTCVSAHEREPSSVMLGQQEARRKAGESPAEDLCSI